jgi:hypothetical protein
MPHRRLVAWLFPIALLLAQAGGLAHGVTHARADAPAKDRPALGVLCDQCASFAKLTHLATDALAFAPARTDATNDFRPERYAFAARVVLAYRSRGPPAVL